jgi:hypothetical protein
MPLARPSEADYTCAVTIAENICRRERLLRQFRRIAASIHANSASWISALMYPYTNAV